MAYKFGNSLQRNTPAIFNLIIINTLVYLAQKLITTFDVTQWGSLHYYNSALFKPHQIVTSMFMHDPDDFFHLVFNMFALWMFGSMLEKIWGSKKFILFYLICGIGASLVIELFIPFSAEQFVKNLDAMPDGLTRPEVIEAYKQQYMALGASGAIMGVMAAFAYLFPNTELYVMFIPIPLKAKYVIPVFILIEVFEGVHQFKGDNVGHFAHLGGAFIGFLLVLFWNRTNRKTLY